MYYRRSDDGGVEWEFLRLRGPASPLEAPYVCAHAVPGLAVGAMSTGRVKMHKDVQKCLRMEIPRATRPRVIGSLVLTLALLLTACGVDENGAEGTAEDATDDNDSVGASADDDVSEEGPDASEDPLEIIFVEHFPEQHAMAQGGSIYFLEQLESLAEGHYEISVEHHPGGTLFGAQEVLDVVRDGTAQATTVVTAWTASYVPPAGVSEVPGYLETSRDAEVALWQFINENLMDDYLALNVRPIHVMHSVPFQVWTRDRPLESVEDLSGLTVRSGGGMISETMEILGATPVELTVPDAYSSLERGVIDGTIAQAASVTPNALEEVLDYATTNLSLGGGSAVTLINEDWYQSLSDLQREHVDEAAERTRQNSVDNAIQDEANTASAEAAAEDVEYYEVPDIEEWERRMEPLAEMWIERMNDEGYDGAALMSSWERIVSEVVNDR